MSITENDMEAALEFLADSDEKWAMARSLYEGLNEQKKTVKAVAFMRSNESAQTAKEQDAYASQAYKEHLMQMQMAQLEYLTLDAHRLTATMRIECWRSLNASRRRGVIT